MQRVPIWIRVRLITVVLAVGSVFASAAAYAGGPPTVPAPPVDPITAFLLWLMSRISVPGG